jgi:3-deoxy-D-manno-octulosonic-acid transferase/heptosyltransferase-1
MLKMNPKNILIVKLSAIGDVVHSLPLLEVLHDHFPEAQIDWLVEEEAGDILRDHPAIARLIISRRKSWQKEFFKFKGLIGRFREIRDFLRRLRERKYDLVIDLQGLLKSGIWVGLARAQRKIGFTGGREGSRFFLTEPPFSVDYDQHALERYLKTADFLGCNRKAWKGEIPVSPEDQRAVQILVEEWKEKTPNLVAINPMAKWSTKCWAPDRFAQLADRIRKELHGRVLFTGSAADRPLIENIIAPLKEKPLNLAGRTNLKQLAYLYSQCRLLVSTDTGSMHIAAAMNCPIVALFGPTAPRRTGPYGKDHIILRDELACSPCFKKNCSHRSCMQNISVDRVFEAVKKLMENRNTRNNPNPT